MNLNNLGIAHYEAENFNEAAGAFRLAAQLDPAMARAHFNLGNALFALDSRDGRVRWSHDLGTVGYANPMTYRTRAGKQFVVRATGAGANTALQAFALR